jgi:hypothetical protein
MDVDKVRRATEMLYNLNANLSGYYIVQKKSMSYRDVSYVNECLGRVVKLLREADDEVKP